MPTDNKLVKKKSNCSALFVTAVTADLRYENKFFRVSKLLFAIRYTDGAGTLTGQG